MSSNLDARVASTLDRAHAGGLDEDDEDALLDELDKDEDLDGFRERRLQQLHDEFSRTKQLRNSDHGAYDEIKDEKALMDITTSTKLCIVHFWKPDFNRCRIMDGHLETLAPLHLDTRFVRINVTNAPFLVTKLQVQVLPAVIAFIDGLGKDRIIGFEGLGRGNDRFTTRDLENRLLQSGVLKRSVLGTDPSLNVHTGKQLRDRNVADHEDEGDDWD